MPEIPKLKILTYGDPGSGKTYFAGTFTECEDTSPVLVLDSRGQRVTFNLFPNSPLLIYPISTMKAYNLPYMWIKNGQPWSVVEEHADEYEFYGAVRDYFSPQGAEPASTAHPIPEEDRKFRTIVLDSLTQTQRIGLREITGDVGKLPGDVPTAATYAHWGKTLAQLTLLADLFYQLPIHVLITALRRHQYVEAQGITMYYPFFWGQSALEVPSYAEIVGMLVNIESLPVQQAMAAKQVELEEGDQPFNVLLVQGSRMHQAKWQGVRSPPSVVVNPTAAKMLDVVCGVYMP